MKKSRTLNKQALSNKPASSDKPASSKFFYDVASWRTFPVTLAACVGVFLLLNSVLPFALSEVYAILTGCAAAVIVHLATLNKRVAIITASIILAAVLLGGIFFGGYKHYISLISGFFGWWTSTFPEDSMYSVGLCKGGVVGIIAVGSALAVRVCFYKAKTVWRYFVLVAFVFMQAVLDSYKIDWIGIMLCILSGVSLLAYTVYGRGELCSSAKNAKRSGFKRFAFRFCAIFTAAVCTVLSFVFVINPEDSRIAEETAAKVQQISGLYTFDQRYSNFAGLRKNGLQPELEMLGGSISLDDQSEVARVYSEYASLLKCYVYTDYDGKSWSFDSSESIYVLNDGLSRTAQEDALGKIPDGEASELAINYSYPAEIINMKPLKNVFSMGRTLQLQEDKSVKNVLRFNERSEIFSFDYLPSGYSYASENLMLSGNYVDRSKINEAAKKFLNEPDKLYDNSDFYKKYTALPGNFSNRVTALAESLTFEIYTDYEKASALENYFKTSDLYTYTLFPGDVPDGEEFVSYFIKSKRGYCVYFATAMAAMARSLGIPSRMVSGYGMVNSGDNYWVSRESFAHAWVECYIRGLGWVSFDPTPVQPYTDFKETLVIDTEHNPLGDDPGDDQSDEENSESDAEDDEDNTSSKDEQNDTSPEDQEEYYDENKKGGFIENLLDLLGKAALYIAILIFLAVLSLFAVLRCKYTKDKYSLENIRKRKPDTSQQAEYLYRDTLYQLKLYGIRIDPAETMLEFEKRLCREITEFSAERNYSEQRERLYILASDKREDEEVCSDNWRIFEIMTALRYGHIRPTDGEIELICEYHNRFEGLLREKMGRFRYFIIRRIGG